MDEKVGGKVVSKQQKCTKWGGIHGGAQVTEAYSEFRYWTTQPQIRPPALLLTGRLHDKVADGECAYLWFERRDAPVYDLWYVLKKVCGQGESATFEKYFDVSGEEGDSKYSQHLSTGRYSLYLCNSSGGNCRMLFTQLVTNGHLKDQG